MFNPTALQPIINDLRRDAGELRARRSKLVSTMDSLLWEGPRGDRYRARTAQRAAEYERRAAELEHVAAQVADLKREVERELRYLVEIQAQFQRFVSDTRQAVRRVAEAAERAMSSAQSVIFGAAKLVEAAGEVATGDLAGARQDLDSARRRFTEAQEELRQITLLESRHSGRPAGDRGWREADAEARQRALRASVGGVRYRAPQR